MQLGQIEHAEGEKGGAPEAKRRFPDVAQGVINGLLPVTSAGDCTLYAGLTRRTEICWCVVCSAEPIEPALGKRKLP